jgi:hypothetical protein
MTSNTKVLVKFLPFEVKLQIDTSLARRLESQYYPAKWFPYSDFNSVSSQRRKTLTLDVSELTSVLKEYFDEYLRDQFGNADGKTIYAPFSHVSLSSINRRRLLQSHDHPLDHVLGNEFDNSESTLDLTDLDIIFIRSGNLRKRNLEVVAMSKRYDGVAVFTRDGDLPIPSSNFLQAKQLQAQADVDGILLGKLQSSSRQTGLHAVTAVELGVSTSEPELPRPGVTAEPNGQDSFDAVIIIAVTVAACSMALLIFALFLAFRRRQGNGVKMEKTNEISPTTRDTEKDLSPQAKGNSFGTDPPLLEIKQSVLQHDDAISEYTESVYSLPSVVKSAKKAWLQQSVHSSMRKPAKTSTRFNPKYILSSRSNASSSADEDDLLFENRGATEEMEGVPQMTSPMKEALMEAEKKISFDKTTSESNSSKHHKRDSEGVSRSGLYPAEVIDDDITSSLSAYANGIGISKQMKTLVDKVDDGASVCSYESYGFSLDGADYSTVANSTKYGY